ncbi:unnamed protein product, partial [Iphiclides podalirius]
MESIIQYAKRTIDQLKRISNGDYLTDKAKEQWKMPANEYKSREGDDISKAVMAKSDTFRVESDRFAFESTLRNLVRSELDMRCLSKILAKGRSVRIPRLIVGSCKLFGECRGSELIIKCKQGKRRMALEDSKSSQFEIILKLVPNETEKQDVVGPVLIFEQTLPCKQNEPFLPLEYKHSRAITNNIDMQNELTITEIDGSDFEASSPNVEGDFKYPIGLPFKSESSDTANTQSSVLCISDISLPLSDPMANCYSDRHIYNDDESSTTTKASCTMTPDDLFCTIQQFNAQTALLEDIEECPPIKKKSPTKVRIKSPYENKAFAIEERKRRKLLEIRERREKRKKALSENCKVTKHKYEKTVDKEKKFSDLIDDALRESRGEAVKGPSKPYTRLESLAQPKRFAIGAQEEIKSRHGKHSLQDKTPQFAPRTSLLEKPSSPLTSSKARQKTNDQECGSPTKSTNTNYIPPTGTKRPK